MKKLQDLKKINFKFNKRLGQNFIFDQNFLKTIVRDNLIENCDVLEVGAGAGSLTQILCQHANKVLSYEIDKSLKPILDESLKKNYNLTMRYKDVMSEEIDNIDSFFDNMYYVFANIPYYITTPIIFKFLKQSKKVKSMILLVQKEVAERITAKVGGKEYGALNVSINCVADTKILKTVSRHMFFPHPKVDSAFIRIDIDKQKYDVKNYEFLFEFIINCFKMRRKTILNNLKSAYPQLQNDIERILLSENISLNCRPETIEPKNFVNLANKFFEIIFF